jgi:hypothetical protein
LRRYGAIKFSLNKNFLCRSGQAGHAAGFRPAETQT